MTLSITIRQNTGVPFYRQIEDQLAALIRSGRLAPGTRLPSFRELAKDLLVSLITVRRAYADLENDGLIVRRHGQGSFVADNVQAPKPAQTTAALEGVRAAVRGALLQGAAPTDITDLVKDEIDNA
jgi:GntR family transcriptional regulator